VGQSTSMKGMFYKAKRFDQDLSSWDTSRVLSMSSMFHNAESFRRVPTGWSNANVKDMTHMFYESNVTGDAFKTWATPAVEQCRDFCLECVPPDVPVCTQAVQACASGAEALVVVVATMGTLLSLLTVC